jgi:hypothetical protein
MKAFQGFFPHVRPQVSSGSDSKIAGLSRRHAVRLVESSNWLLQVGANLHAGGPGVDRAAASETKTRIVGLALPVKARGKLGRTGVRQAQEMSNALGQFDPDDVHFRMRQYH